MNSASAGKTFIKMQNQLLNDDDCACFLVEAIAQRSQNIKWETTVDKKKVGHKMSKGRPENRRPVDQETKKDNKNIIQKMVFPCPYRLLDTTFSILILSWRDLHHNRKIVPISCRLSAYYVL